MRSVPWIIFYVGILVGVGYVLASVLTRLLHRRVERAPGAAPSAPLGTLDPAAVASLVGAVAVVVWSVLVFRVMDAIAPGSATFREFSAVGFLASRSLTAWESASLWAALAGAIGLMFPLSRPHQHSNSGYAVVGALLIWYLPITALIGLTAFFAAQLVGSRQRTSATVALLVLPVAEWAAGILQLQAPWGYLHGPETALWVAALVGALAARRLRPIGSVDQ